MPETESERYYRRKNMDRESSAMLWDAVGQSIIAVGMPMCSLLGFVGGLSLFIDLPFVAWAGIGTVLLILLFEFWTKKVMREW